MINSKCTTGKIVADDYRTAIVFKKHGIDFCCNGYKTISEACVNKKISAEELIAELEAAIADRTQVPENLNNWPVEQLIDHIEEKHHRYTEERITQITGFLNKVCKMHGDKYPELNEITQVFKETASHLSMHMKKEEEILFPYIKKLASEVDGTIEHSDFSSVKSPIASMMNEHQSEAVRIEKISSLSQAYTVPTLGCATISVTYSLLKELEEDLYRHIHLENNILFPQAEKLEKMRNNNLLSA